MRMHADSWVVPCMWQRGGAYGPWPHTAHMDTCWHALRANVVPRALWHHMGPTWWHGLCDTNGAPCGAMGCVAPLGAHVVPRAMWHHLGPTWCHRRFTVFYFVFSSHQAKNNAFYCVFPSAGFGNIGNYYALFEMVEIIMNKHSKC